MHMHTRLQVRVIRDPITQCHRFLRNCAVSRFMCASPVYYSKMLGPEGSNFPLFVSNGQHFIEDFFLFLLTFFLNFRTKYYTFLRRYFFISSAKPILKMVQKPILKYSFFRIFTDGENDKPLGFNISTPRIDWDHIRAFLDVCNIRF